MFMSSVGVRAEGLGPEDGVISTEICFYGNDDG